MPYDIVDVYSVFCNAFGDTLRDTVRALKASLKVSLNLYPRACRNMPLEVHPKEPLPLEFDYCVPSDIEYTVKFIRRMHAH